MEAGNVESNMASNVMDQLNLNQSVLVDVKEEDNNEDEDAGHSTVTLLDDFLAWEYIYICIVEICTWLNH